MNASLIRAGTKPVVVELLMGHAIGLQHNYLRLETEELLAEYLKAVDMLTVSQEKQLQQENVKLRMEVADVDKLRSEVSQVSTLKQELYELREQNKWLDQQVNKILKQGKLDKKYQRVKKILRRSDSRIAEESEEMASE
jgi:hypothetical protein